MGHVTVMAPPFFLCGRRLGGQRWKVLVSHFTVYSSAVPSSDVSWASSGTDSPVDNFYVDLLSDAGVCLECHPFDYSVLVAVYVAHAQSALKLYRYIKSQGRMQARNK